MFTSEERERTRAELVRAAEQDSRITGAAHLGSFAADRLDAWSDIDLALCISPGAELNDVVSDWNRRLYENHDAIAHCDVRRGDTLYRVFLLRNTLQVDVSFWPAREFRATSPKFKLIFGAPSQAQRATGDNASELIGMAWLHGLHVRSSIARGRFLQAEYMLGTMRNQVLALACLRNGLPTSDGRGFDDLAESYKAEIAQCYLLPINAGELSRAFSRITAALLAEITAADPQLAQKIAPTLTKIVESAAAASKRAGG